MSPCRSADYAQHATRIAWCEQIGIRTATSRHHVTPVTRGSRWSSFFWIQSMVRSDEQRRLLFDMDNHLRALRSQYGETEPAIIGLTSTYHNLLRAWLDI